MSDNDRLQPPPLTLLDKFRGQGFTPLYTTTVTVSGREAGHGSAGTVRSDDGNLVLDLDLPEALGGPSGGTNPEQLFAASYAACFRVALILVAKRSRVDVSNATVAVEVSIGRDPVDGGYALIAEICIRIPGVERHIAEGLVRDTERLCPYAKMAHEGMHSIVSVID
jgi:Ohr subfamily peroxiredoxin